MNVVIYARFSSHSQTEQSIEGQLKECYAYAQRNDYTVVGEYIDRALSGTTDHRPEFQKMIADSSKKTFQGVLVYQLDRFARNRYDSATYKSKLKKNGVRVLSARENISDDASGVLMEAVLEGMAEYYSVELAQKIKRGMDINAEKCLSTGGNLALGFKTEDKRIVIDPLTAPIVVNIFEMYVTGSTMADIIRYLNANQIKTSYGNEFNKNSINRILRNKRYIGVYTYRDKEIPDGLPCIVDEDLFWEAQRIMEKNKKAPARAKAKVDYLLTTKLFCGRCKAAMTGISGTSKTERKYHYYQCVTNRRDKSCDKKTVGKEYIEDLVVNRLRDFLTPDNISTIAREVVDLCERESNNGNTRRLKKLLAENEQATENLLKALESGQAVDIIADRIAQKKKEHEKLSLQLLVETSQHPTPSVKEIRFFLNQFRKGDINDPKYRQGLVDMLVNKIYLYDDKMTVLCNTQDGHFDVDLKEVSSLKGQLVEAMSEAGFFDWVCLRLAKALGFRPMPLMLSFMVLAALLSMFVDSITVVLFLVVATARLAHFLRFDPVPMIIGEIFAANLGGAATMSGDPPNIIIGTSLGLSFWDFLRNNGVICLIGLVLVLVYFYLCFRSKSRGEAAVAPELWEIDPNDAIPSRRRFLARVSIFGVVILLIATHTLTGLTMPTIGVLAAAVTLVSTKTPQNLVRQMDWKILGFIIGLFLTVSGLEQTGVLDGMAQFLAALGGDHADQMVVVLIWFTAIVSAFVDNIPMATVMVPVLLSLAETLGMDLHTLTWAVSKGTDIGGIATPIGASANVTGVALAAKEGHPISWKRYCKYAMPAAVLVLVVSMVLILALH